MKNLNKWLPVLIFLLALGARLIPGARTIDDSFITYRYARNILAGDGFVYNAGEAVMGTTTPLYTLLMVALGSVSGGVNAPFPLLSLAVNALADALTAVILWKLGNLLKQPLAAAAAGLVWAITPHSVTFAIGGLETSVYVLLLTGSVFFYLSGRITPAAFLAGLAVLTRPDAIILVIPIMLDHLIRVIKKQAKLKIIDLAALGTLPLVWYGFATWMFGSPIPHSVQAKMGAYHLEATEGLVRLLQHYTTPFLTDRWFGAAIAVGFGLILYPFLYFIGARAAFRQNKRIWPFILYPWLYFLVFAIANPLIFRWYLTPPLPAYFLFILIGINELVSLISNSLKNRTPSWFAGSLAALLLFILPLGSTLSGWVWHPDHGNRSPAPEMAWYKLELLYKQAASEVSPYLDAGKTLAAGDVGVLGFYTPARILDLVGLNSPVTTSYYPLDQKYYVTNYAVAPDLVIDQQPDAVVILEVYGRLGLLKDERFNQQYQLLQKLPTDIYGSDGMLIFLKK
jgi:hypothetical protein